MCLKLKGIDAEHYRKHLLDKYGVGVIADGDRDIRIAFSPWIWASWTTSTPRWPPPPATCATATAQRANPLSLRERVGVRGTGEQA